MTTTEKLQKILAGTGLGSRRVMEQWIEQGRVLVNGKVAKLGDRINPHKDKVVVDGGRPLNIKRDSTRVILYNKPIDEVCTRSDPQGRPTVFTALPSLEKGRWISVGRLDVNTAGLLLFTNDGVLANQLMHPSSNLDREYLVRVLGEVDGLMLERLKKGVQLEDGKARFTEIKLRGGRGANQWYHVVIKEGRKREVRRLWESQGLTVSRLKRIRFACIVLPEWLSAGKFIELKQHEINELRSLLN